MSFLTDIFDNAVSLAFDAEILRRRQNYKKALQKITFAINKDKNNPDYYMVRALIYRSLNDAKKALSDLNKSIELNPDYNRYYMYRYLVNKDLKDDEAANKDLEILNNSKYKNNLDTLFECIAEDILKKKDFKQEDVINALNMGIKYNPNNEKLIFELLKFESAYNMHEEALKNADKLISMNDKNSQYYLQKADILVQLDRNNEALDNVNKALEINPTESWNWWLKANIYYEIGNYTAALEAIEKAIQFGGEKEHNKTLKDRIERKMQSQSQGKQQ